MERIIIIGCSGAGKSTLSRALGTKLDLPVVHLDKLWWKPGWVESEREEFDAKLAEETAKARWIIDGNYHRTLEKRLEHCDMVIYLDFNRITCILGVLKRVISTYGSVRPDMGAGCPERFDLGFLKWVWGFNKKNRKNYLQILSKETEKSVLIFKNRRQVKSFLDSL